MSAPSRKSPKGSAIIPGGSFQMDRQTRWVRPPAPAILESLPEAFVEAPLPAPDETASLEEAPAGPGPEELARQEAERILEAARVEADELRRVARESGYAEGLKEGVEAGRTEGRLEGTNELQASVDRWIAMMDSLAEAWRHRFEGLEEEAKDLALAAAERMVAGHLALKPEAVLDILRECLRHAAEADQITVLVSPKDVALLRERREELAASLKGSTRFELVEDEKLEAGSIVVETRTQVIDASGKTKVEQLRNQIRGRTA